MKQSGPKKREQAGLRQGDPSSMPNFQQQARDVGEEPKEHHIWIGNNQVLSTGVLLARGMKRLLQPVVNVAGSRQATAKNGDSVMPTYDTSDDQVPSTIDDIQFFPVSSQTTIADNDSEHSKTIQDNAKSAKDLETDYNKIKQKIHSFPASLQGVGQRYIRPKLVTIGPYYTETEIKDNEMDVKRGKEAAMHSFVSARITDTDEVSFRSSIHDKFASVSHYWGSVYDKDRLERNYGKDKMKNSEITKMMFRDGCFLLQFIRMCTIADHGLPKWLENWFDINRTLICNDIMLLENQLPWVVLNTLNDSRPNLRVPLEDFVAKMGRSLQVRRDEHPYVPAAGYKPPHLLGYLWHYKTGGGIQEPVSVGLAPMSKTVSVIELAAMGIYMTCSKTTQFKDMGFTRRRFTRIGKISLAPLLLDEVTSSWLVNMAAFEVCIATLTKNRVLSSYLALLAMLMDGEQDVHELRASRIVQGDLTNKETLDFFKTLSKHIRPGHLFFEIMEQVESYRVSRFIWIFFHKFLYNSFSKRSFKYNYTKTIMTMISLFAVVVAFYKVISILENRPT